MRFASFHFQQFSCLNLKITNHPPASVCTYVYMCVCVCLILCAGFFGCICFLCRFICIPFCAASRFMFCVFSLFHYLVYLSLLMTFKWHLLSARNAGGREGRENKESGRRRGERAMNGNRKATHTHSDI